MKTKKCKKILIVSSIILIITLTITGITLLINMKLEPYYRPSKEKIETYFKRDREYITLVANYFANSKSSIHLKSSYFKSTNIKKIIKDQELVDAITRLFENNKYSIIGKEDNTIYFQKWTRGQESIGIIYSINGKDKPVLEYLTKLEPLEEEGWYFYKEEYSKRRV